MYQIGEKALATKRFDTIVPLFFSTVLWNIAHDGDTDWSVYKDPKTWPKLSGMLDSYLALDRPGVDKSLLLSGKLVLAYRCEQYELFLEIHDQHSGAYRPNADADRDFDVERALKTARAATGR